MVLNSPAFLLLGLISVLFLAGMATYVVAIYLEIKKNAAQYLVIATFGTVLSVAAVFCGILLSLVS